MEIQCDIASFKNLYSDGSGDLYHPVPEFVYDNLLRSTDKAAFVHKYLEFNLHFTRLSLVIAS